MKQTKQNVSSMSNEGRNSYAITNITNAFLELLSEKQIEDISISELTDKAGVGRATFYRNYEKKEDIVKIYILEIFNEWINTWDENPQAPLSEHVRTMIAHFENHYSFYKLLNDRGLIYLLKDVIIGLCGPKPEHEAVQAYASSFAAYTLYGWIDTWFARGMRESSDEISDMFKAQGL